MLPRSPAGGPSRQALPALTREPHPAGVRCGVVPAQAQLDGRQPVSNPGPSWATTNRGRQLFYPPWMEGTWQVG